MASEARGTGVDASVEPGAQSFDRATGGDARGTRVPADVATRRRQLYATLREVAEIVALAQFHGSEPTAREVARLYAASKELATIPGTNVQILADIEVAQAFGLSDRPEWKEKTDAVDALAKSVAEASPTAQRARADVEGYVEQQTPKLRGGRRPLPACVDPTKRPANPQTFQSKVWRDLEPLIEELLRYKSIVFTQSVLALEQAPSLDYREMTLDMDWSKKGQQGTGDHLERWRYREATLVVPELPEDLPPDVSRLPPGRYHGTVLDYEHELVGGTRPAEDLRAVGDPAPGRNVASFAKVRRRASLVIQLLYHAVGEAFPDIQKTYGPMLRDSLAQVELWRWTPVNDAFIAELPKAPVAVAPARARDAPWYTRLPPSVHVTTPRVTSVSLQVDDQLRKALGTLVKQPPKATFEPRLIHFAHAEDVIRDRGALELRQAIEALKQFALTYGAPFSIEVAGHADKTGDRSSNYDLGMRRALCVAKMLEKALGKSVKSIYAHTCGDRFAPSRNREPEYRVAIVSMDVDEMR